MSAVPIGTTSKPGGTRALRGICPLDLTPLDPIPATPLPSIQTYALAARSAQEDWARTPFNKRKKRLEAAAQDLLTRRSEAIDLVRLEVGKQEVDALFTESLGPIDALRGWARVIKPFSSAENFRLNPLSFPRKEASVSWFARGLVVTIAPWNFPIAGLYRSAFPALLSGNAWIVKPSEYTPRSSGWFAERLAEHLPNGLVHVVQGTGEAGEALIPEADAVVFTGSTATGRKVAARCAELNIPCSAEMGGNDAAIVLGDADGPRTTAGLTQWALQNAGQSCGAIEVAYIEHRVADTIIPRLALAWSDIQTAPLAHAAQLTHVETHVADALQKGATLVCGGKRCGDGLGYLPTLLDNCTESMSVVHEETFGPVMAICRVEGPTEAIRRINRGHYGLTASIWTRDINRAHRLAKRLEVGVVTINNHGLTGAMPELPWSGTKDSGYSIANSRWSLSTYLRPQALLIDRSTQPEPYWLPHDASAWALGDLLADLQLHQVERAWRLPLLLRERYRRLKRFFDR